MIYRVTIYSTLPAKQVLIHFPQLKIPKPAMRNMRKVALSMAGTLPIWRITPLRTNDRIRNETGNLFSLLTPESAAFPKSSNLGDAFPTTAQNQP